MEAGLAAYAAYWNRYDVLGDYALRTRLNGLACDIEFLDRPFIDRDPFYQEFRRSLGIRHLQSVVAATGEGEHLTFSVHYGLGVTAIAPDDRRRFEILARHIQRAGTLMLRTGGFDGVAHGLGDAIGRMGFGAAVIDRRARIVLANDAFGQLFAGHGSLASGRVQFRGSALQDQFARMLAGALDPIRMTMEADFITLARADHVLPLILRVMPLRQPSSAIAPSPLALAMIADPAKRDGSVVKAAFLKAGLTPGEARLADLVGSGVTLADTAERLGIRLETARTVLKKVFTKLDVARQAELVGLVERISPIFRP